MSSDDDKTKPGDPLGIEESEWDNALGQWESELDGFLPAPGPAAARASTQENPVVVTAPVAPPPPRPLYRPPPPRPAAPLGRPTRGKAAAPRGPEPVSTEVTRLAQVPAALLEAAMDSEPPTLARAEIAIDLDVNELTFGLEDESTASFTRPIGEEALDFLRAQTETTVVAQALSDEDDALLAELAPLNDVPTVVSPAPKRPLPPSIPTAIVETTKTEITLSEVTRPEATAAEGTIADRTVSDDAAQGGLGGAEPLPTEGTVPFALQTVVRSEMRKPLPEDLRPSEPPPPFDRGAAAARRTVRQRRAEQEDLPLVGAGPLAVRTRRALLLELASRSSGRARAELLVAAAELSALLSEPERIQPLLADARRADPEHVVALRELRRVSLGKGDHEEGARLLEAESELDLSAEERAAVLVALAEVQLVALNQPVAAERSARAALDAHAGPAAAWLLAECCWAQNRPDEAYDALEQAGRASKDRAFRSCLLLDVARHAERRSKLEHARELYLIALTTDGEALDGSLGLTRCASSAGALDESVGALLGAAEVPPQGPLSQALRRAAARRVHLVGNRPDDALMLSHEAKDLLSLWARVEAARPANNRDALVEALLLCASLSGSTDRALALVEIAEVRAERGDLDGAESALREAALADHSLGTIRVVREILARKSGDASQLAYAIEKDDTGYSGGALVAAAKVGRSADTVFRERELLTRAQAEGSSAVTADVLLLDVAASLSDVDDVRDRLKSQLERTVPTQKLGPMLACVDHTHSLGDSATALVLLEEAVVLFAREPLVLRPLGRQIGLNDTARRGALWLEEAAAVATVESEMAGFAATTASRWLEASGSDIAPTLEQALGFEPSYLPAAWWLERLARQRADAMTVGRIVEAMAAHAPDGPMAASLWTRAALARAAVDAPAARTALARARALAPKDLVVTELTLRLSATADAKERALLLESTIESAPPELERVAVLRSARALMDAGDSGRAIPLFERALSLADERDGIAATGLQRSFRVAQMADKVRERVERALKSASVDARRRALAEQLAELDWFASKDSGRAIQAIRENGDSDSIFSLRLAEREAMADKNDVALAEVEERLCRQISTPEDLTAHGRFAARLRLGRADAAPEAADGLLLGLADRALHTLWFVRSVEPAARAAGNDALAARMAQELAAGMATPIERASMAVRAAEAYAAVPAAAADVLLGAAEMAEAHPVATAELGRLQHAAGNHPAAGKTYERAAAIARLPRNQASLWYRAGQIWQDNASDTERAMLAFVRATEADPAYLDAFARAEVLLLERGETAQLADLTVRRIAAGGDPKVLVELHTKLARLRQSLGDLVASKEALRSALGLDPDRTDALQTLAQLCLADSDWRGAAEALIRIARLRKEGEELRWVFFSLGDIYDQHLPDRKRAEAAFRRVLKMFPDDLETLQRLATLYEREQNVEEAIPVLRRLAIVEPDTGRSRAAYAQLAWLLESKRDHRGAEATLEQFRKHHPTDLGILKLLADLYQRQNAEAALSMHLHRAVTDLRAKIHQSPTQPDSWMTLIEILTQRGRPDAARSCASAARALGLTSEQLTLLTDVGGGIAGAPQGLVRSDLDELLSPPLLTPATRAAFRLAESTLDKTLPVDLRALGAEKLTARSNTWRAALDDVSKWFKGADVTVYLSRQVPLACLPVASLPVTLVLGHELYTACSDEAERRFLLSRAVKIALTHFAVLMRADPTQLGLGLCALMRTFDPSYAPPGFDPTALDRMARTMQKTMPRKAKEELMPMLVEMAGATGFDAGPLGAAASELGNRAALLAVGSTPAALGGLLRMANLAPSVDPDHKLGQVQQVPEAAALLSFAISDTYFEARQRAQADRV